MEQLAGKPPFKLKNYLSIYRNRLTGTSVKNIARNYEFFTPPAIKLIDNNKGITKIINHSKYQVWVHNLGCHRYTSEVMLNVTEISINQTNIKP